MEPSIYEGVIVGLSRLESSLQRVSQRVLRGELSRSVCGFTGLLSQRVGFDYRLRHSARARPGALRRS